jgi:hypothetical protein
METTSPNMALVCVNPSSTIIFLKMCYLYQRNLL